MPRPGQRSIAQCRSLNNQNRVLGVPYFCYSIIYPKTLFEVLRPPSKAWSVSGGQASGLGFGVLGFRVWGLGFRV